MQTVRATTVQGAAGSLVMGGLGLGVAVDAVTRRLGPGDDDDEVGGSVLSWGGMSGGGGLLKA